jgi:hypothetical protein
VRAAEAVQQAVPGLQRRPRQRRRPLHRVNQRAHVLLVRAGPAGSTCAGVVKAGRAGALLATLAERAVRFVCTATTTYANISQHPRIRQRARNSFLCRNPTHREPALARGRDTLAGGEILLPINLAASSSHPQPLRVKQHAPAPARHRISRRRIRDPQHLLVRQQRAGRAVTRAVILPDRSKKKRVLSAFPMSVPSLSCQTDHLQYKKWKRGPFSDLNILGLSKLILCWTDKAEPLLFLSAFTMFVPSLSG